METETHNCQLQSAVCRYCRSRDCYRDIVTEYIWMGEKEVYHEMLSQTFNIEISILKSEEGNNYEICDSCILILRDASEFKKRVLQREQTIKKYLNIATSTSTVDSDGTLQLVNPCANLDVKLEIEISNNEVKREIETDNELNDEDNYEYINIDADNGIGTLQLANCRAVFDVKPETEISNNEEKSDNKTYNELHNEDNFQYDYANYDTKNCIDEAEGLLEDCKDADAETAIATRNDSLLSTRPVVTLKKINLSKIKSKEKHSHSLKRHTLIHTSKKPHQCDVCKKCFSKLHDLKRHKLIHTEEKPYQCDLCKKCFRRPDNLKMHKLIHTGNKPYQCDICKKGFSNLRNLKVHMLVHTEKKSYQCDVCNKCFSQLRSLKTHMSVHTGENPYQCDICKKCYSNFRNLKIHTLSHTVKKPYQCDLCKKCFRRSDNLEIHKLVHTEEKPYQCDICKKCFSNFRNLTVHMLVHTEKKPYQCHVCNKCFSQLRGLKTHMSVHSGKNPYQCDICKKCFSNIRNLRVHALIHTGKKHTNEMCAKSVSIT